MMILTRLHFKSDGAK